MKITTTQRCEDSTEISVKCKDRADAQKQADKIAAQPHVIGCTVKACAGGVGILSHVARYQRDTQYDVPTEVADSLVKLKLAKKA